MKKRSTKTGMQDNKLRHECSATWGGNRQKADAVAFRVTARPAEPKKVDADLRQQWPLTEEEEALLCG